jgi:hypothetical protein
MLGQADPISDLLLKSYGPVGLMAAVIYWLVRQWVGDLKEALSLSRAGEKDARAEINRLQEAARETTVVITKATDLMQRLTDEQWRKQRRTAAG